MSDKPVEPVEALRELFEAVVRTPRVGTTEVDAALTTARASLAVGEEPKEEKTISEHLIEIGPACPHCGGLTDHPSDPQPAALPPSDPAPPCPKCPEGLCGHTCDREECRDLPLHSRHGLPLCVDEACERHPDRHCVCPANFALFEIAWPTAPPPDTREVHPAVLAERETQEGIIDELRVRVAELEKERDSLNERFGDLFSQAEELQARVEELEKAAKRARQDNDDIEEALRILAPRPTPDAAKGAGDG